MSTSTSPRFSHGTFVELRTSQFTFEGKNATLIYYLPTQYACACVQITSLYISSVITVRHKPDSHEKTRLKSNIR